MCANSFTSLASAFTMMLFNSCTTRRRQGNRQVSHPFACMLPAFHALVVHILMMIGVVCSNREVHCTLAHMLCKHCDIAASILNMDYA